MNVEYFVILNNLHPLKQRSNEKIERHIGNGQVMAEFNELLGNNANKNE